MQQNPNIGDMAKGRWRGILPALGIEAGHLVNRHGPCPICQGGKDRFRFDDKEGRGTWFCSHCGAGDGLKLLMLRHGWDFKTTAARVGELVGSFEAAPAKPERPYDSRLACRKVWSAGRPVLRQDPVGRYLFARLGLTVYPACLRYVERLRYEEDGEPASWHPAMVALVRGPKGEAVGLHRTYLTPDGVKAAVGSPKKLMRGSGHSGCAIRLAPATDVLGVAEGIETSFAAARRFAIPVWATISADIMAGWWPPEGVTKVVIFGDTDRSLTGQAVSYTLGRKLISKKIEAEVRLPEGWDVDWADLVVSELAR